MYSSYYHESILIILINGLSRLVLMLIKVKGNGFVECALAIFICQYYSVLYKIRESVYPVSTGVKQMILSMSFPGSNN